MSTTSKGNYYKAKTKKWFESLGYETQLVEFMTARPIAGRTLYIKKDVFDSDGISMNGNEIIFWNSKHYTTTKNNHDTQIREAKKKYLSHKFPPTVKLQIIMWKPRIKQPEIIEVIPNCIIPQP
jgi:hypothetical protein